RSNTLHFGTWSWTFAGDSGVTCVTPIAGAVRGAFEQLATRKQSGIARIEILMAGLINNASDARNLLTFILGQLTTKIFECQTFTPAERDSESILCSTA